MLHVGTNHVLETIGTPSSISNRETTFWGWRLGVLKGNSFYRFLWFFYGSGRGLGGGGRGWGGGQEGAWGAFFHTFFSFMWFFSILFFFLLRSSETPTTLPFLDMNLEYPRQAESNCVHRTLNVFYSASKHPEIPMKYAFSKQKTIANISTQFDIGSCCCEY